MTITEQELDTIVDLLNQAIVEVKAIAETMSQDEAREYFILAMVLLGFNQEQLAAIIKNDKDLTELFSAQAIH